MKKLPKYALENDVLYLWPKTFTPEDPDAPWYKEAAVGKNTLSVMVKEMCAEAGIGKKQTIVCMLLLLVPCLGQTFLKRSSRGQQTTALRTYEQVSTEQQKTVSKVLMINGLFEKEGEQSVEFSTSTRSHIAVVLQTTFLEC